MKTLRRGIIWVIFCVISTRVCGLKLVCLIVPATANIWTPITLSCEYDLEGRSLYSVKWYKDDYEFFRYMPDYEPQIQSFQAPGITLDFKKCDMNRVTLKNLQFNTSGNYKCEVSSEAPNFETVASNASMAVMAFPAEDPVIDGIFPSYWLGDYVIANCTSGKSNPPAVLTWHINGIKPKTYIWEYRKGASAEEPHDLYSKTVGLHFQILNSHLTSSSSSMPPRMEIRCTSNVGGSLRQTSVYTTLLSKLTYNKLAQEGHGNSAVLLVASTLNTVLVLFTSFRTFCWVVT